MLVDLGLLARSAGSRGPVSETETRAAVPIRSPIPPRSRYWRCLTTVGLGTGRSVIGAFPDDEEIGGLAAAERRALQADSHHAGLVEIPLGEAHRAGADIGEEVFLANDRGGRVGA